MNEEGETGSGVSFLINHESTHLLHHYASSKVSSKNFYDFFLLIRSISSILSNQNIYGLNIFKYLSVFLQRDIHSIPSEEYECRLHE